MSARAIQFTTSRLEPPARATTETTPTFLSPARAFPYHTLAQLGRTLDELERARKKTEQRIGAAHRAGSAPWHYEEEILAALLRAEHFAELDLCRLTRTHPLWESFAKPIPGLGENLFGRLLAEVGDPITGSRGHWRKDTIVDSNGVERHNRVWVIDETYPRNVNKLWAYCGFDPNRMRPRKGASQEEVLACGKTSARTAAVKIAMQFKRTVGGNLLPNGAVSPRCPYRDLFDERKEYELSKLPEDERGRNGHADNRALRFVAKRFLRELWRAACDLEAARAGHHATDTQADLARADHQGPDTHRRRVRAGGGN